MRPAVFVDRDGTLIEERHYLNRLEQVALFPWSAEALRRLRAAGYALVLVSNQSGVARGLFDEAFVREVHDRIAASLAAEGAALDGYYYCPHHPEGVVAGYREACRCRKPGPGLVERAAFDLGLDPSRSWVVGDAWSDVALARAVGARGLLVRTGHGGEAEAAPPPGAAPAAIVDTLLDAADWILDA